MVIPALAIIRKKAPLAAGLLEYPYQVLQLNYIFGCRTFGAIDNFKRHPGALLQRFEALGLDCRVVNENIFAAVLLNKTKAL